MYHNIMNAHTALQHCHTTDTRGRARLVLEISFYSFLSYVNKSPSPSEVSRLVPRPGVIDYQLVD